ncbi:radical SAM protein, partial [candidate division KSB1 bacterium]|nr:radical SAM protein [candidate division KSB1 bacterium]
GIVRVRFTSPHPKDFPMRLLEVMAANPKVCKHIHLPLQAGNDRILHLMRRTYGKEAYLQLVEQIRQKIPQITFSTDIIVGFPTETDEEFADTVEVVERVRFDSAFIFKYSERPGTLAAKKYADDVPAEVKTARIVHLNALQKSISLKRNQSAIGRVEDVLVERMGTKKSPDDYQGRTDGNKLVILPPGAYRIGDLLRVRITGATAHVLKGEAV